MKLFKFPMRDNSKYIKSHSYTKISQTGTQFPMHPLKTICTVKMAWHNELDKSYFIIIMVYLFFSSISIVLL